MPATAPASRISKVTYPSGFAVAYSYNATGYQFKLANAATAQVYWTAESRDAELHLTQQTAGNGVVTQQAFDANTGQLTDITAGEAHAVHRQTYTYDLLGKLLTRSDANTSLSESFEYDTLNRLTKSTVSLSPTPWVQTIAYNAVGNITFKSDVGTYSYPAPGQPKPHGVTSITGGVINTTFTYDAKGNMISGNGLTVAYTSYNKTASITRGTTSISFEHDTEHQRFSQMGPSGTTLYLAGGGVFAERFAGLGGGGVQWTNYLIVGGRLVGVFIQKADETTSTRYFHTDHLGSISVITNESGGVVERLSFDAWGKRRNPDGSPDPAGAITSETNRGFTGHEQLDQVGLIHMNGRVYDPLLARFGTPDPMTENPFSTQGWNRYSYVGNSPVNFTDPSGYCFMGCFWQPVFRAVGNFFRRNWGAILQIAATAMCGGNPVCGMIVGGITSAAVTGITSGNWGAALRAGLVTAATIGAMWGVGELTGGFNGVLDAAKGGHGPLAFGSEAHLFNMAGHALVGCARAVASRASCGSGALAGAIGPLVSPALRGQSFGFNLVANSVLGGLASVAGGGDFANGALTAAFGYLFNEVGLACRTVYQWGVSTGASHCGLFVFDRSPDGAISAVRAQFSLAGDATRFNTDARTMALDLLAFLDGKQVYTVDRPWWMSQEDFEASVIYYGQRYRSPTGGYGFYFGPNSNTAAAFPIIMSGAVLPSIPGSAPALDYWKKTFPPP